jgi:O-antigen/teichoic acid export membrane protein
MKESSFRQQLTVLGGGAAIAQLIPFLFSFVITRVFNTADFATFGLFLAISGPLSNIVCLRYELALVLPREDEEALQLLRFSQMAGWFFAGILLLAYLSSFAWNPGWIPPVLFLFLAVFSVYASLSQASMYWMQRKEWYKKLSLSKVIQNTSVAACTLLLGWLAVPYGLMLGYLAGWTVLFVFHLSVLKPYRPLYTRKIPWDLLSRYRDFPLYNTLPALLQSLTASLPFWLVVSRYDVHESGSFSMARQLMLIASGTGAVVLSQLYFQRSVKHMHEKNRQLPEFVRTLLIGSIPSAAVVCTLWAFGEPLFAFFFGDKWIFAGKLSSYLAASMMLHISVYPLSFVLNTLGKTKWLSLWQLSYFLVTVCLFLLPGTNLLTFCSRLVLVDACCYLSLFGLLVAVLMRHDKALRRNDQ